jgi:beta-lactam-binding protein with PASTA domain
MFKRNSSSINRSGFSDWLIVLPFVCFTAGYFFIAHFFGAKEIETPALIGKKLQEAARELSALNLNLRIVTEKPDAELQAGTIISQTPSAGKHIKENQSIFIVISKKLPHPLAPECLGKHRADLQKLCDTTGIHATWHYLEHALPKDLCFAQYPSAGTEITDRMIIYVSSGEKKPIIWPNFTGIASEKVIDFLTSHDISAQIIQANHIPSISGASSEQSAVIIDQRPQAGSLILLDSGKMPRVQLQVQQLPEPSIS